MIFLIIVGRCQRKRRRGGYHPPAKRIPGGVAFPEGKACEARPVDDEANRVWRSRQLYARRMPQQKDANGKSIGGFSGNLLPEKTKEGLKCNPAGLPSPFTKYSQFVIHFFALM